MTKSRFTFADAKTKISELEDKLEKAIKIVDANDNVFDSKELKVVKRLEIWAILGPLVGLGIGLLF